MPRSAHASELPRGTTNHKLAWEWAIIVDRKCHTLRNPLVEEGMTCVRGTSTNKEGCANVGTLQIALWFQVPIVFKSAAL